MPRRNDIDPILRRWEFRPGEVSARLVRASDGREVLQMRIDLGVLQLEVSRRPDGQRPGGAETYFDYLVCQAIHDGDSFVMTEEQCAEADREFVQFYQRRICWLALREYERAVRDADHSLAFMDFVSRHSPNTQWTMSHEQYRPFIMFQRTQAAALAALDEKGPEAAIERIEAGRRSLAEILAGDDFDEDAEEEGLLARLNEFKESLRDHFSLGRTLDEQLAEAVASEEYEKAAELRDEIARRKSGSA